MPLLRHCHTTSTRSSITKATESDLSLSSMICATSWASEVISLASASLARSWMKVAPPRNASSITSVTGLPLVSCGPTTKYADRSKLSRIEANG